MTAKKESSLINIIKHGNPNNKAILVPNESDFSYSELIKHINHVIEQLIIIGIQKNDRVAIYLTNKPETIITFLAISEIATAAPLNPAYTSNEVKFYIEDTNAKFLITSDEPTSQQAILGCPENVTHIIVKYEKNKFNLITNKNLTNKLNEKEIHRNNKRIYPLIITT